MKKGWQQRKITENAWGLIFTRWYIKAPSGNMYFFYRGCYFPTVIVPSSLDALSDPSCNRKSVDCALMRFDRPSGKKIARRWTYHSPVDGTIKERVEYANDMYSQAVQYIYQIEENGGFPEQQKMNKWLENNNEARSLFSSDKKSISYCSMP
ncbi:hypothetical protein [Butyrivibrio sp.]|uniref:hypothetical protein n=1 Tax=Butyrivibrio sp. TaxID=28121 RepID=UPI0025B911B7|nr:hypothetical protein [Butyrivibrio sp.]MBQ9303184.1 hypothetical protein [Butyrivibrio sp.]